MIVLTDRGKDYLKATAFTLVIVSVAGPAIAAAFAFSLAVTAAILSVLLRLSLRTAIISLEPTRMRVFKGESRSSVLRVGSQGSGFSRASSVVLVDPFGLQGQVGKLERGSAELTFRPMYAGSFRGIRVTISLTDALGLFAQTQEFELELVVQSLPTSLLLPDAPMLISPMVQGEVPTGGRGAGQEMYSIEPYAPGSDAKDIMWKRMARSGGESMHVRVREASARTGVRVLMVVGSKSVEEHVRRVDLASEAIAQLGKKLVSLGVGVELACWRDGEMTSVAASSVSELSAGIVNVWAGKPESIGLESAVAGADLLVLGPEDARGEGEGGRRGGIGIARGRPTLVIWDAPGRPSSQGSLFFFTGTEDLTPLAEVLLEG